MESLFSRLDFKPLVFGTFHEMSSNVKEVVNMAVEYGMEHLGRTMAATTVDGVRTTLRRRYRTQLSLAVWRGYDNLILDRVKYVGTRRHDAWVQIKLRSGQECKKGLMTENLMGYGWHMKHMCPCGMPSPTGGRTGGRTL